MSTENRQGNQSAPPRHYSSVAYNSREDEIDLLDLFRTLLKRKRLIIAVAVLCAAIAVAVALLMPPVYKATAHLLPPSAADIHTLRQVEKGGLVLGSEWESNNSVYEKYKRNANSLAYKRTFFEEQKIATFLVDKGAGRVFTIVEKDQLFDSFLTMLTVRVDKKNSALFSINLEWYSAEGAADLVNKYVEFVRLTTQAQLLETFDVAKVAYVKSIGDDLAIKRISMQQQLERSLVKLDEALVMARSLSLVTPVDSLAKNNTDITGDSQGMMLDMSLMPLYYRGSKAIEAEIHKLTSRTSGDTFIPGIGALLERMERSKLMAIKNDSVKFIKIDRPAYPPLSRIKPKRSLIVVLGCLLGVMLGVMGALFAEFVSVQKNREKAQERRAVRRQGEMSPYTGSMHQLVEEYEVLAQQALNKRYHGADRRSDGNGDRRQSVRVEEQREA